MTRLLVLVVAAVAFVASASLVAGTQAAADPPLFDSLRLQDPSARSARSGQAESQAIFAGGCFWSMEHVFDEIPGVQSVTVGYTGGTANKPSYQQVELGITGHVEAVRVVFDPSKVDYATLLNAYWRNTDPTEGAGQFCDFGPQYRPIIFYTGDDQRRQAESSKEALQSSHRFKRVATRIEPASTFWIAEPYHQHFYKTHATAYEQYRIGCGRDRRLRDLWRQ